MEAKKLSQKIILLKINGKNSAKKNGKAKWWQPEEDTALKLAEELELSIPQTVDCMNDIFGTKYRWYTKSSIVNRRLKMSLGKTRGDSGTVKKKAILDCKKLLMQVGQSLVEYSNSHSIIVKCNECNHEWVKQAKNCTQECPKCSTRFVGKMPIGLEPALVYLLIFPEWDKCKIGYTKIGVSSSPEEAIHRASKNRNYPYPYIIGAYDLSTKTDAAILEQNLLNNTTESKSFIEKQEFDGYTEFRNIEVLKQLLPEYKTILDTALRI